MELKNRIIGELDDTSPLVLKEVLDFILFLKHKEAEEPAPAHFLSEHSLKKTWSTPEEDMAWESL